MKLTLWEDDLKLIREAVKEFHMEKKIEASLAGRDESVKHLCAPGKCALEISKVESRTIIDALSNYFALKGVDVSGEPNALGLQIESVIDSVYRYDESE